MSNAVRSDADDLVQLLDVAMTLPQRAESSTERDTNQQGCNRVTCSSAAPMVVPELVTFPPHGSREREELISEHINTHRFQAGPVDLQQIVAQAKHLIEMLRLAVFTIGITGCPAFRA